MNRDCSMKNKFGCYLLVAIIISFIFPASVLSASKLKDFKVGRDKDGDPYYIYIFEDGSRFRDYGETPGKANEWLTDEPSHQISTPKHNAVLPKFLEPEEE